MKEDTKLGTPTVCFDCGKPLPIDLIEPALCRSCKREKHKKPFCCHIPCDLDATWEIIHGSTPSPDDYTHSCDEHISDLLTDADQHTLVSLET